MLYLNSFLIALFIIALVFIIVLPFCVEKNEIRKAKKEEYKGVKVFNKVD